MRILLGSLVLFILIVGTPAFTIAQEGHHISIMGGGQLTRINNRSDYDGRSRVDEDVGEEEISPESTYNPALRLRYTYNFEPNYGFQTGIIYSVAGQSYAGLIADTAGQSEAYQSQVTLNYLRIPAKFRFNSSINSDVKRVYLSIGVGFSVDILTNVTMSNNNSAIGRSETIVDGEPVDYYDLYQNVTASFVTDALLNFKLSDQVWLSTGFNLTYGLSDIENKQYDFPDNTPKELFFPVSTKKVNRPDLESRDRARNFTIGLELGLKYYLPRSD